MIKKALKTLNTQLPKIGIFFLVLSFTFILRTHNFDKIPFFGHLEEMLFAWSGIYLVETGTPVSWSTLDYPSRAEIFRGKLDYKGGEPFSYVRLYKPWLDEPPLFSLMVGEFAHFYKADRNDVIPTSYIRTPMVFIALLTSIMVFLTARLVSGYWVGILSMFLYGSIPIFVISSRMAVPENLIALLFIITVYLLLKFQIAPKFVYLLPIPLLAGIAGLSKPTGFFILPLAVFIAFAKKYYSSCLYLILAITAFIGFFIWYGMYFDTQIFWHLVSIQGFRPVGFSSLGWLFISPAFDISILTESWYIFALLCAFYFILKPQGKQNKFIIFSFVYWVIIVMLSGGAGDLLPWYRYPFFPLLAIIAAWGLQELVVKADFFATFITAGLLLGNRHLLTNAFRPDVTPLQYRSVFSLLMLPSLLSYIYENIWLKKLTRAIIILVIIVGSYFNILYIYNQYEIICENVSCPLGPTTSLSSIHFPVIWRWLTLGAYK